MKKLASVVAFPIFVFSIFGNPHASGQTLSTRPHGTIPTNNRESAPTPAPQTINLTVPAGTPLKIALDKESRVQKVGQPVHGKLTEPVYSFDKLLIPAGSDVSGHIVSLIGEPAMQRTMSALNADFSPPRKVQIEFTDLALPDGRHMPLHTVVCPGSVGVLQFVPAKASNNNKDAKNVASRKISDARQQARSQWETLKKQWQEPGKMHRLKRYAVAQLPYRPQYLDAGTVFNADLQRPLQFGSEPLQPGMISAIGDPPPAGSVVHALLVTPLNSAITKKGAQVDAIISQPLVVTDKLLLPEGSHLHGTVLQVQPARRFGRNGQLRIVFHEVTPPDGVAEKVEASLEGVEVSKGEHLTLDSEGGAQVTTPRTRYLTTGIQIALAASAASPDRDAGTAGRSGGEVGQGAATGASGFKLVGMIVGIAARSRLVSQVFGIYGAGISVYSHFLARGRDVVYPKDMSMLVSLGTRQAENQNGKQSSTQLARQADSHLVATE